MSEEKIDQRLREEMRRLEPVTDGSQFTPVLIELKPVTTAGRGGIDALEQQVRAAQESVRRKLVELGAAESVRPMTLANAIEARLAPGAIRELAALPEVTRILWNRAERVTA